jgi:hypothetical protein
VIHDTEIPPFQLWALSVRGEIYCFPYDDLASAQDAGESMVQKRAWRTWDAFEVHLGRKWGGTLVASHGNLRRVMHARTQNVRIASESAARRAARR